MDVQRLQVLLVSQVHDDVSDVRAQLRDMGVGADVHVCADPADALDQIERTTRPDVLLVDMDTGDDVPLALLERLREDPGLERVPVIAIVADESGPRMDTLAGLRVYDTTTRPMVGDALHRIVAYFNEV